jgi:hypothetical protein
MFMTVDAIFLYWSTPKNHCLRSSFRALELVYPLSVFPGLRAGLCLLHARSALLRFFVLAASIHSVTVFGPGVKKFHFSRSPSFISAPTRQSCAGNFFLAVRVIGKGFSWFCSSLSRFDFLRGLLNPDRFSSSTSLVLLGLFSVHAARALFRLQWI